MTEIKSIDEIVAFLREQADLRAAENDEAGVIHEYADKIAADVAALSDRPWPKVGDYVRPMDVPEKAGHISGIRAVYHRAVPHYFVRIGSDPQWYDEDEIENANA